ARTRRQACRRVLALMALVFAVAFGSFSSFQNSSTVELVAEVRSSPNEFMDASNFLCAELWHAHAELLMTQLIEHCAGSKSFDLCHFLHSKNCERAGWYKAHGRFPSHAVRLRSYSVSLIRPQNRKSKNSALRL